MTVTEKILTKICREIVGEPSSLKVNANVTAPGLLSVELAPCPDDARRLIGRGGDTYRALRAIAEAVAAQEGLKLEFRPVKAQPFGPGHESNQSMRLLDSGQPWPTRLGPLLDSVCEAIFDHPVEISDSIASDNSGIISTVAIVPNERPWRVKEVVPAIVTVFNAVGRAAGGRAWTIVFKRSGEPEPKQPVVADGRFAKESGK